MCQWRRVGISTLVFLLVVCTVRRVEALLFTDGFDVDSTLEEAGTMSASSSPSWWLNSGGRFVNGSGLGRTIHGELPPNDRWRLAYSASNPLDTDGGYHPQNVFRLVTRGRWRQLVQQVFFRIDRINASSSPNRNASNGVLLFNRYQQDGQTLYYAGVRVDGAAVIKKKLAGVYTTLGYVGLFPGFGSYNATQKPSLLPIGEWIGIRSYVTTNADGSVDIQLQVDPGSGWQVVLDVVDSGKGSSGAAILDSGYAGIRADFLDAVFQNYRIRER